ncbi:MAG: smalltalk protein [Bacteroidaceae bacterium]|nr:smalltalk protein [Bacteroidaceae bacterium]
MEKKQKIWQMVLQCIIAVATAIAGVVCASCSGVI